MVNLHTLPSGPASWGEEAEIDAGIREADHGEDITKEACEAMGYKWNEGLQACIKSDGAIHQGNWGAGENAVSSG